MASEGSTEASAWDPLRQPLFRAMWLAAVVSNVGTWMQNVGAAWLMTSLTTSTLLVALVQTATTLPIFFFALPAGAVGDIVDRRFLLLVTQVWMLLSTGLLGALTLLNRTTPVVLLLLTFSLGLGGALNNPTWQAIQPELVTREEIASAVSLGSVGFNLARAVGPALGGLVVSALGPGPVFVLNAVSFLAIVVVVYRWDRPADESTLPPEHLIEGMRGGIRYVRNDGDLRAVMVRTIAFIFFASALWALLPVVARARLGLDARGYGVLLGLLGVGAVVGAGFLPRIRRAVSRDALVVVASVVFAGTTGVFSVTRSLVFVGVALLAGGAAWLAILSNLNTVVQSQSPKWVRARTLAVFLLFFQGGLAVGSAIWGVVANYLGPVGALQLAAVGLFLGIATHFRWRLPSRDDVDLDPALQWAEPTVVVDPDPEGGPILVTIQYAVEPEDAPAFLDAMADLGRVRRRNGAYRWGIFRDTAHGERYLETYVVASWVSHLRQHERNSVADQSVQDRAESFHTGDDRPAVSHYISGFESKTGDENLDTHGSR